MIQTLHNHLGEKIDFAFVQGGDSKKSDWLVLVAHGVTGNKDRPIVVDAAKAAHKQGFSTLAFSFSGNGESEGDFTESNITKEVKEVSAIIKQVEAENIIYIGHSLGGAVGVLAALENTAIRYLVSLAGMINTRNFALTEFGELEQDNSFMWDEELCPLSTAFMKDLCDNVNDLLPKVTDISIPWLLLHGTEDDVVLPVDTENVVTRMKDRVSAHFVKGGDHSFNGDSRETAMTLLSNWLAQIKV